MLSPDPCALHTVDRDILHKFINMLHNIDLNLHLLVDILQPSLEVLPSARSHPELCFDLFEDLPRIFASDPFSKCRILYCHHAA